MAAMGRLAADGREGRARSPEEMPERRALFSRLSVENGHTKCLTAVRHFRCYSRGQLPGLAGTSVGTEPRRLRNPPSVAPFRDGTAAALAPPLRGRFDPDLRHNGKVCLPLSIPPFAFAGAAPKPLGLKFRLAVGATDVEAAWSRPGAVVVRRLPLRITGRAAVVVSGYLLPEEPSVRSLARRTTSSSQCNCAQVQ